MAAPSGLATVLLPPAAPSDNVFSPARQPARATASPLGVHVIRLHPGDKLVAALSQFVLDNSLRAPFILTCVGSAVSATIRLASALPGVPNEIITLVEKLEILSLVGTLTPPHRNHLHISFGDKHGRVVGGHLIELEVFTTAEIVIGECLGLTFDRPLDPATGWDELTVEARR